MKYQIPTGLFDLTPQNQKEPWQSTDLWLHIEKIIRETAHDFGYEEIRTPIFERAELFQRSVGKSSDIVSKEMYFFEDKGKRLMALRPEGTAAVMRAFIENHLREQPQIRKLYYLGPMFRYDRPQAGRYRQHHQFGVEAIGTLEPEQDGEVISLLYTTYQRLGLKNLVVSINSIGDTESRHNYRNSLQDYFSQHKDSISKESLNRLETNPLRILDSKDPKDRSLVQQAPKITDYLSPESKEHFEQVQRLLNQMEIPFEIDPYLVRGLDYYNRTVFEVISKELGAQNSIGGGGRYDGLLKLLGGPDLPAIGFGAGIERVIQTLIKQHAPLPQPSRPLLFMIPLGEEAKTYCYTLLNQLRQQGISTLMDFRNRKLKKTMQLAHQSRAKYVAIIGEEELSTGNLKLKDMDSGEDATTSLSSLEDILKLERDSKAFMGIWETMNKPFKEPGELDFFLNKVRVAIQNTHETYKNLQKQLVDMEKLIEKQPKS